MSEKQKRIFRITLILPFLLLICVIFFVEQNSESSVKEQSEEALLKKYRKSFAEYFEDTVFIALKDAFKRGIFEGDEIVIADRTVMFSHQGERFSGKAELEQFFAVMKKMGVSELIFTVKSLEVFLVEDPIDMKNLTIDAFGFGIWTYEMIKKEAGEAISVLDPGGETDSRHHSSCVWEPHDPGGD